MKEETARLLSEMVRAGYDSIARHFSNTRVRQWPEVVELVSHIHRNDRVLDLGCGNGRLVSLIMKRGAEYLGVDNSEALLAEARKQHPQVAFVTDDMRTLRHVKGTFDHICMIASLHHVPSYAARVAALRTAASKLAPDGTMLITVWNLYQPRYWKFHMRALLKRTAGQNLEWGDVFIPWKDADGTTRAERYYHACTKYELERLMHDAGLVVDSLWYAKHEVKTTWRTGQNICVVARRATVSGIPSARRKSAQVSGGLPRAARSS